MLILCEEYHARPPYPKELAVRHGLDDIIQSSWNSAFEERPSFSKITRLLEQSSSAFKLSLLSATSNSIGGSSRIHGLTEEPEMGT